MSTKTRFLIIRYSGLGDLVMLLPTLQKLKIVYPESSFALLTDSSNRDFANLSCGLIDDTITLDRKVFKQKRFFSSIGEIGKMLFHIRKRFDICIDFQSFGETATISYLVNAKEKWGAEKKSKYNYGYTRLVPYDTSGHRSQLFARIAGVDDTLSRPKICLTQNAEVFRQSVAATLDSSKPTVGLNIGSTSESRRWSEQNFFQLASELSEHYTILVFIGPLENRYKEVFKDFAIIENTTLEQLCGAISLCSYFISNDTGPVHLAAALGIPTITLFSTGEDTNVGCLNPYKRSLRRPDINAITVTDVSNELKTLENDLCLLM
ncbi:glycosyltransferase family 9 protein [Sulfuricurvum sp.]|uniref:glycosyltransferase family 9 protein n=1 Tax=Sulfuricurvum sp. TaxID=2025608 RepID=UPI00261665C3|nr:glycosyltransferase family 9 protein [Sulfuricurvum sp.]MDD4882941.1 glycosyltransferase family 9 protein [Sulfuricurvum sp.]